MKTGKADCSVFIDRLEIEFLVTKIHSEYHNIILNTINAIITTTECTFLIILTYFCDIYYYLQNPS